MEYIHNIHSLRKYIYTIYILPQCYKLAIVAFTYMTITVYVCYCRDVCAYMHKLSLAKSYIYLGLRAL